MCGEKCEAYARIHGMVGSPPRMRGKERYHFAICEVYGITPAYAGKSAVLKQLQHSHMDHPRVCGEKLLAYVLDLVQHGITPAYAGKRQEH